jgi:hypothetical protein
LIWHARDHLAVTLTLELDDSIALHRLQRPRKIRRLASCQFGELAADLVVLNGDPSRDVRALASVRYTIMDGKVIYRSGR